MMSVPCRACLIPSKLVRAEGSTGTHPERGKEMVSERERQTANLHLMDCQCIVYGASVNLVLGSKLL